MFWGAGRVGEQRFVTVSRVEVARGIAEKRRTTGGRIAATLCVDKERLGSNGRVGLPVVLLWSAEEPLAVLSLLVLLISARKPVAVLSTPVVLLRAPHAGGRVFAASGIV